MDTEQLAREPKDLLAPMERMVPMERMALLALKALLALLALRALPVLLDPKEYPIHLLLNPSPV